MCHSAHHEARPAVSRRQERIFGAFKKGAMTQRLVTSGILDNNRLARSNRLSCCPAVFFLKWWWRQNDPIWVLKMVVNAEHNLQGLVLQFAENHVEAGNLGWNAKYHTGTKVKDWSKTLALKGPSYSYVSQNEKGKNCQWRGKIP
jgi:hypothetical protein